MSVGDASNWSIFSFKGDTVFIVEDDVGFIQFHRRHISTYRTARKVVVKNFFTLQFQQVVKSSMLFDNENERN